MKIPFQLPALTAAALFFTALQLQGLEVPIEVENAGFESPPLSDNGLEGSPPGWDIFGVPDAAAVWNVTNAFYPSEAPEGYNIADIFGSPAYTGFSQTITGAQGQFQTDTTYTLKVLVGLNLFDTFDGYIIQLLANDVVLAQDDSTVVPGAGSFVQRTITYNYNPSHVGLAGEALEIRLLTKGLAGGVGNSGATNFDKVQLSFETVNAVADHGGPYRLSEGDSLAIDGTGSLPADGASSIVDWDWDLDNDGQYDDATGATPADIAYATLTGTYGMGYGTNTIGLRVEDDLGNIAFGSTTVTIFELKTYTGPNAYRGNKRWNIPEYWNNDSPGGVPEGAVDVVIPAGKEIMCWDALTPEYTGDLRLEANTKVNIGWTTGVFASYNCLGTPGETTIYMDSGSYIQMRMGDNPTVPAVTLEGDALISTGTSSGGGAIADFDFPITGNHQLTFDGNRLRSDQNIANLNAINSFAELRTPSNCLGIDIRGNRIGSLGNGNITMGGNSTLTINATGAINESAAIILNNTADPKLTMNADDTCANLIVNGAQYPAGTYGSTSSSADNKLGWISGNKILTVLESPSTYWDTNGATAGAGGATPFGTWGSSTDWTVSATGESATTGWISGSTAAFAAGSDATGTYTVGVAQPSGITVTKRTEDVGGNPESIEVFQNVNSSPTGLVNETIAWDLNGGNAVVLLISCINAEGFTATYDGQAMTVIGALSGKRNAFSGIAYIIDPASSTGDVVINMPYDNTYSGGTNTGGYGHFGCVYSLLSLKGVGSAGTHDSHSSDSGERNGTTLTYSTSANNSFVVGVGSDNNWQTGTKSVTGICSTYLFQSRKDNPTVSAPGYYNTVHAYGSIPAPATYNDTWVGQLTSIITLPFEASPDPNDSFAGQTITGLRFEDGSVTLNGAVLNLEATSNSITVLGSASGNVNVQLSGDGSGINKRGSGTLILSNSANDYTGFTRISNGTLQTGTSDVLPNTSDIIIGGSALGTTATLDLNGNNETVTNLTLGGDTLTSAAAITTGAGTLTLNGDLIYSSFDNALGATISGNLALNASPTNFIIGDSGSTAQELAVPAIISGSNGLTKLGYGTLALSGDNAYTGLTTIQDGEVYFSGANSAAIGGITVNSSSIAGFDSPGAINGTTSNLLINSSGLIYFGPSFGAGNIPSVLASRINTASGGVIAADNFENTAFNFSGLNVFLGAKESLTYTGTITPNSSTYRIGGGPGTVTLSVADTVTGANDLIVGGGVALTASNDLSGTTTISSGFLQIGGGGTTGALPSSAITNNGVLTFYRSNTVDQGTDFHSVIAGSGTVQQAGSGTLILDGANTYSGGTTLLSGSLTIGSATGIGSGPLSLLNGTLDVTGPITLTNNNNFRLQGSFTYGGTGNISFGSGTIENYGSHTITLGGSGTTFTANGGVVNITDDDHSLTVNGIGNTLILGGYEMSVSENIPAVQLTLGGSADIDITGTIDDKSPDSFNTLLGSVIKEGSGTLTLTGNNNYTGQTVINGGVVDIPSGTQVSDFVVNGSGKLALTLGSTITTTGSMTLEPGHAIRIHGSPSAPTEYTLMTADAGIFAIAPTLETPIADGGTNYILQIDGNDLKLVPEVPDIPAILNIVDDQDGGPVQSGQVVTYTITFDRNIVGTSVDSADFVNAGTSTYSIGTIADTGATTDVFTVQVSPTSAGTLRLRIPSGAKFTPDGSPEATTEVNIDDNTTIQVTDYYSSYMAWSGGGAFGDDANSDGIVNGLAWILGANNSTDDSGSFKPVFDMDYDLDNPDFVTFYYPVNTEATDAGAEPLTRYTSNLSSWTTAVAGSDITITTFVDGVGPGIDLVEVGLRRTLAVDNRMFLILSAEAPTAP